MKKILIVVPDMPYPFSDGGKKAQFDFIENMRFSFEITMIFILREKNIKEFEELASKWDNVTFIPYRIKNAKIDSILSLPFRITEMGYRLIGKLFFILMTKTESDVSIAKTSTLFRSRGLNVPKSFIDHFKKVVTSTYFDFVQIEFHDLVSLASSIPAASRKIYIHHELRYVREEREIKLYSFSSPFLNNVYKRNKSYELSCLNKYQLVCTLSEHDKKELERQNLAPQIYSSPIPVILSENEVAFKFDNSLVFLGGETHFPNKEGVDWFLNNCWLKIKESHPLLKLSIIGKWSEVSKNKYQGRYADVFFQGFVSDLSDALRNKIMIVPIRIGSGVRIKIIEAVNLGVPFISTSIGVEGLNFKHNQDCLIGNSESEIVNLIDLISHNDQLGLDLARNAKEKLIREYSYNDLIDKRMAMYHENSLVTG